MNFYTVRDLRVMPKSIWENLSDGNEVIITNNGKPTALMLDISDDNFEETLRAVKQAQAMMTINTMRKRAAEAGFMTDDEINAEINAARDETRLC